MLIRCVVGSSVSLAPALISIYDDHTAATSSCEGATRRGVAPGCWKPASAAAETIGDDIDRVATSAASCGGSATVVKRSTTSAAAGMVFPEGPEMQDMKKRPLSIRSTSSNSSTVSATQRRRRKKQAVGDGVVCRVARPDVEGDLAPVTERLGQQAASFSDELNSLTSSLLEEHSESESFAGGAVRLSSLLTDDDDADVDASPSSDCSDAAVTLQGHDARSRSPSRSESYVDLVVAEILDTERAYVSDLRDIVQVCVHQLVG